MALGVGALRSLANVAECACAESAHTLRLFQCHLPTLAVSLAPEPMHGLRAQRQRCMFPVSTVPLTMRTLEGGGTAVVIFRSAYDSAYPFRS
jgi:hypothetical protein